MINQKALIQNWLYQFLQILNMEQNHGKTISLEQYHKKPLQSEQFNPLPNQSDYSIVIFESGVQYFGGKLTQSFYNWKSHWSSKFQQIKSQSADKDKKIKHLYAINQKAWGHSFKNMVDRKNCNNYQQSKIEEHAKNFKGQIDRQLDGLFQICIQSQFSKGTQEPNQMINW